MSGLTNHLKGMAAEDRVMRAYLDAGHRLVSRRWRGPGGEIDLVLEKDGEVVFVEVKSSRTFAQALQNLTARQIARLLRSAEHCLGFFPQGSLTPARFDVALVDGVGRMEIRSNAFAG